MSALFCVGGTPSTRPTHYQLKHDLWERYCWLYYHTSIIVDLWGCGGQRRVRKSESEGREEAVMDGVVVYFAATSIQPPVITAVG